ncbi:MAG TPA: SDR family oxidoreductase [Bryobacteraceae bacterium]|nr:SDR family oxidoreductase [Bryobacteraceae bacterium]
MTEAQQAALMDYLEDTIAAEQNFENLLRSFGQITEDQELTQFFTRMASRASSQHQRLTDRLKALGGAPSGAKTALAMALGSAPAVAQAGYTTPEKSAQHLVMVYSAAAAEMAMYEALASAAAEAGDAETEKLARDLQAEEREDYEQVWQALPSTALVAFETALRRTSEKSKRTAKVREAFEARRQLKHIDQQVVVITGASSGIGLATAKLAAYKGAKVVAAARNLEALETLSKEFGADRVATIAADVGNEEDMRRIAQTAIDRFGGFDTWINNAGVLIYGKLLDVSIEDMRRLFETNFWGTVYGSRIAAEHLRERGGALINVGSVESDRTLPLQGIYSASKHAVQAFTDALRMELEKDDAPVSVTLVKPGTIDTPITEHARNYLPSAPQNPGPAYTPQVVAKVILHCAEHPVRHIHVGSGGRVIAAAGATFPRLTDKFMEATMFEAQHSERPAPEPSKNALHAPNEPYRERGDYPGRARNFSVYTTAALHPWVTALAGIGMGVLLTALVRSTRR